MSRRHAAGASTAPAATALARQAAAVADDGAATAAKAVLAAAGAAITPHAPVTTLVAPLDGPGALVFRRFTGTEEISRLHAWEVDVVSRDPAVDPSALLGRSCTVVVDLGGDGEGDGQAAAGRAGQRYLDGIVTRFGMREGRAEAPPAAAASAAAGSGGPWFAYRLLLRPWLWLATRHGRGAARVFEDLTVPAIVARVLAPYGYPMALDRLARTDYRRRPRTLQYDETDFDFVSRLCEEEGICWFCEHGAGSHRVVFSDGGPGAHRPLPGGWVIPFFLPQPPGREAPHADYWAMGREAEPDLAYLDQGGAGGNRAAALRCHLPVRADAHLNQRGIAPGYAVLLQGHPQADQNQAHLVVAVDYHLEENPPPVGRPSPGRRGAAAEEKKTGAAAAASSVQRFAMEVHLLSVPYRPERITPRPRVRGPQVGVVVAVDGDAEGGMEAAQAVPRRVKVRLPVAGEGGPVDGSAGFGGAQVGSSPGGAAAPEGYLSDWAPVLPAGGPAGQGGCGGSRCMRRGAQVVVDFLQGDPEQPVVVGCWCVERQL